MHEFMTINYQFELSLMKIGRQMFVLLCQTSKVASRYSQFTSIRTCPSTFITAEQSTKQTLFDDQGIFQHYEYKKPISNRVKTSWTFAKKCVIFQIKFNLILFLKCPQIMLNF